MSINPLLTYGRWIFTISSTMPLWDLQTRILPMIRLDLRLGDGPILCLKENLLVCRLINSGLVKLTHCIFIASGLYDGTAFIEILPTGKMVHLAFL